ncbi:MAG: hypothetical protein B7C24_11970 [Bacteroidetes bacterium 4572_77]|nr:MAG: hypothetical protein B7C24_11970 [Bacteroidetes bacterium 4572_77]
MNRIKGKLTNYILTHKPSRVGLIFIHGVGDNYMFVSSVIALRERFPDTEFIVLCSKRDIPIYTLLGINAQEWTKDKDYDFYLKDITFPMPPKGVTKNDHCCNVELGLGITDEYLDILPRSKSFLIGVHFQNTCLPEGANPSEEQAKVIWDAIITSGYIPIEVHFLHPFANPKNHKWDFTTLTCRGLECKIPNLIKIIKSCRMFLGVNSGPYFCALNYLGPNNVIMLEKNYLLRTATKHRMAKAINLRSPNLKDEVLKCLV